MKVPKLLASSVNPEKVGLTVRGILLGLVPLVLFITSLTEVNLLQTDLTPLIDALVNLAIGVSAVVSAIMVVIGAVRKVLVKLGKFD